jgi:PAS domain S-box-containing protein
VVRIQMSDASPPFEFRQDDRWQGMGLDYLAEACRRLGLEYRVTGLGWGPALERIAKGQDVDLLLAVTRSPERAASLALTRPYLVFPQVIFTRKNAPFVGSLRDLAERTIVVEKGYVTETWLRRDVPTARFLTTNDTLPALELLASGKADAYVGNLAVGEYLIDKKGLVDLKVAAPTDYGDDELCMGVRKDWPELAALIDKALASFTEEDHRAIRTKWLSLRVEHGIRARDVASWVLLVAGVGVLFIVQLRRAVKTKTAHLEREIEERRRAERELHESERRYRLIADHVSDVILTMDLDGHFTYFSPSVFRRRGVTPEQACTQTIEQILTPSSAEVARRILAEEIRREHAGEGDPERIVQTTLEGYLQDGTTGWFEVRIGLIRDEVGRAIGFLGTSREITERVQAERALRESQQRYRSLFESAGDAIFVMKDDLILDCNARTLELFACLREDVVGHTPQDFSPPVQPDGRDTAGKAHEKIDAALAGEPQRFEWLHRKKNGTPFLAEVTLSPLELEGAAHLLAIVRDVSERRTLEQRLSQAQKMEAIGTLAGGIAHDFNNILSIITGYVEVALLKIPPGGPEREYLRQVLAAGERAAHLVAQILTFSRQAESKPVPCELSPIVKETVKFMRSSLPANIEIREHFEPVGMVVADPTQIHQVVMNLCTNAFHAMEARDGVLEVGLAEVGIEAEEQPQYGLAKGRYACLTVSDSGTGIPPEIRDRIFEPYFTTKAAGKGTGLGLAVVHGIVTKAGGQIKVCSEIGAGTTFHVFLPVAEHPETGQGPTPSDDPLPRGSERVLLVDDEPQIVAMLRESLEALGYRVTATASSEEAQRLFAEDPGRFDLVITDLSMPRLSGVTLVRELRSMRPGIPVILCTGFSQGLTEERLSDLGVGAVLMKPVPRARLAGEVRRVLDGIAAP